jgi:hypothetical protein
MTIELPDTIDITKFLINPTAGCGDGGSASTRQFRIETSSNGTTFATAFNDVGAGNEFIDTDEGHINTVVPTGANHGVKFVRLTLLNPMHQGDEDFCQPNGCSGTDFIDMTEFEVIGGKPNVLPKGTLSVSPSPATVGEPATFTARFTDPDSAIASYAWDFDGNGTTDRTTTTGTTVFAYAAKGTFTPKVTANDFRGGGTTAVRSITVTAAPPLFPRIPKVQIPRTGRHGSIAIPVTCFARCTINAKLVISRKLERKLGLHSRTLVRRTAHTSSERTVRLKLSKRVRRAMRREGLRSIKGVVTVRATYTDGRRRLTHKTVRIRR